jgi:hypothetical protein
VGREVATLVNEQKRSGKYELIFDATTLSSGVYFYRLLAIPLSGGQPGSFIATKKLLLLR